MAEPVDRTVVERERALPGLGTALDAEAMCRIAAATYGPVREVVVDYLRYKPGTSCLLGYRVHTERGVVALAFGKVCPPEESDRLLHVAESDRGAHPAWVDPELGLLFADASRDRELAIVARLIDPEARSEIFERRRLLEGERIDACRALSYKPGRRWVARLEQSGRPIAVLRAYADERYERALAALKHLPAAGGPWPRLLSKSSRHRLILTSWLEGHPLSDTTNRTEETGKRLGALIARFHAIEAAGLPAGRESRSDLLRAAIESASVLRPELRERGEALVERLLAYPEGGRSLTLHGDLSLDQVIDSGTELALVDLDHVRAGTPETDLGSLIATEWLGVDPSTSRPFLDATLASYRSQGGTVEAGRLAQETAVALVQRLSEPFRRRHPDWPSRMERLLSLAEASVDG